MGDRYNLYESLKLDSAASTEELHANLSNQLSELRDAGVSESVSYTHLKLPTTPYV